MQLTEIIKRALVETVTDIGQLTPAEKRELGAAVRRGWLSKGKGGPFPRLKTVYAHPGFDFAAARELYIQEAMYYAVLDAQARQRNRDTIQAEQLSRKLQPQPANDHRRALR